METLLKALLQGLASVHETLDRNEMAALVSRVKTANPEASPAYAFVAGRNAGIDKARRRSRAARQAAVAEAQRVADLADARYLAACKAELMTLCRTAPQPSPQIRRWAEMMTTVEASADGWTLDEIRELVGRPVSDDVIYQWRHRGLLYLEPLMSLDLLAWLGEHGDRQFGVGYK
jgi:hypothetical protein